MSIDFSVKGKHVLITGGTGGIGAAFAEAFSQAGAVVTIVDIALWQTAVQARTSDFERYVTRPTQKAR